MPSLEPGGSSFAEDDCIGPHDEGYFRSRPGMCASSRSFSTQ